MTNNEKQIKEKYPDTLSECPAEGRRHKDDGQRQREGKKILAAMECFTSCSFTVNHQRAAESVLQALNVPVRKYSQISPNSHCHHRWTKIVSSWSLLIVSRHFHVCVTSQIKGWGKHFYTISGTPFFINIHQYSPKCSVCLIILLIPIGYDDTVSTSRRRRRNAVTHGSPHDSTTKANRY